MNAVANAPTWRLDRRSGRLLAVIAGVALLHLALLHWLLAPARGGAARYEPPRITLRMIPPPAATAAPPRVDQPEPSRATRIEPLLSVAHKPAAERAKRAPAQSPPTPTSLPDGSPPAAELTPPADAPSTQLATPDLVDGDATRRAIRASARQPSLAAVAAIASDEPTAPAAGARLGSAVAGAGHGDCMKGEYAGGGMGLLSVPFLAAALVRGQCAK